MTETRTRELTISDVRELPDRPGAVRVRAVPFGETLSFGGMYGEQVSPDVVVDLRANGALPMLWRHDELIGAWSPELTRDERGLYADGTVSQTTLGADVLTLLRDGASPGASIGFRVLDWDTETVDGVDVETITRIELVELSLTPLPAYPSAELLAVRERNERHTAMPDTAAPDLSTITPRVDAVETSTEQLRQQLVDVREQIDATHRGAAHPLARFDTVDAFMRAAHAGDTETRALVDQVTTNNPGVIPPAWLAELQGLVDAGTPGITALGGVRSLPESGMDLTWPYFDGDLGLLVGEQVAEKNEITSVRVDLKRGTKGIRTLAGGSDISWQLLLRSSPSYREQYLRIMLAAYSLTSEAWLADDVTAEATGSQPGFDPTAENVRGAMFGASRQVKAATGRPASVVFAGDAVFDALGGNPALVPAPYGTVNADGTADAASLTVNVSGLPVVNLSSLAVDAAYATNDTAVRVYGSGPMVATQDDIAKLGTNVAVWGMLAPLILQPAGVVSLEPTP